MLCLCSFAVLVHAIKLPTKFCAKFVRSFAHQVANHGVNHVHATTMWSTLRIHKTVVDTRFPVQSLKIGDQDIAVCLSIGSSAGIVGVVLANATHFGVDRIGRQSFAWWYFL